MGDNTVDIPTGCIGAVIVPDDESAVAKTLKGDVADVGILLKPNFPQVIYFKSTVTSFIINAGAATSVAIHWL